MWIAVAAGGVGLVVAIVLFVLGRRGRRVDDHPLCRRCGYDLIGTPGAERCPECGGALTTVRHGNRRPRIGLVWAAIALLLVSLIITGYGGNRVVREVDWQRVKPQWWLRHDLASTNANQRDSAEAELRRRYSEHKLSPESTRALIESMLARQADPAGTWSSSHDGDYLYDLRQIGLVSDEQWIRFHLHAFEPRLRVPSAVTIGEPLHLSLTLDPNLQRGGTLWRLSRFPDDDFKLVGELNLRSPTFAGVAVEPQDDNGFFYVRNLTLVSLRMPLRQIDDEIIREIGQGTHELEMTVELTAAIGVGGDGNGRPINMAKLPDDWTSGDVRHFSLPASTKATRQVDLVVYLDIVSPDGESQ